MNQTGVSEVPTRGLPWDFTYEEATGAVKCRQAERGDILIVTEFKNLLAKGFTAQSEPCVVVRVPYGSVLYVGWLHSEAPLLTSIESGMELTCVRRDPLPNENRNFVDAVRLPHGAVFLVQKLPIGLRVAVSRTPQ